MSVELMFKLRHKGALVKDDDLVPNPDLHEKASRVIDLTEKIYEAN